MLTLDQDREARFDSMLNSDREADARSMLEAENPAIEDRCMVCGETCSRSAFDDGSEPAGETICSRCFEKYAK